MLVGVMDFDKYEDIGLFIWGRLAYVKKICYFLGDYFMILGLILINW